MFGADLVTQPRVIIADRDGACTSNGTLISRGRGTHRTVRHCTKFLHAVRIDSDNGPSEALTKINLQEQKTKQNKTKEDVLRSIIAKVGIYMGHEVGGGKQRVTLNDKIRK